MGHEAQTTQTEAHSGPKEEIPSLLENYTVWRNSQDMYRLCRILHSWELETDPGEVVYIMADAVYVKEQVKEHVKGGKTYKETQQNRVVHWNIKVEWDNTESYIITDEDIDQSMKELLAFLLKNGLINRYMIFFTDGETQIFDKIDLYFKGRWEYIVYLDYAHIEKKCYDLLSNAIKSKRVADPRAENPGIYVRGPKKGLPKSAVQTSLSVLYTRRVTSILWAGNVEEAKTYLRNIDPQMIAKPAYMEKLLGYLENKGKYIPCYALRKRVGLRNSSNGVEAVNNLIVANDQKSANKAYRTDGSHASASLQAVRQNHQEWARWFSDHELTFAYS